MENDLTNDFNFDLPKNKSNVIKVIGVGGGGSNAINYMFSQGIKGVDFVVSNTDAQALAESPVPIKIQLGASLTEGLGAGANPEIGALAAQESKAELENLLITKTKMVFITAGMGGGTGTGAAPIISKMAKDLDILTVGIVTMPFQFEGKIRLQQAQEGLEKMKQNVDALIVINNNKLRMVYGNLGFKAGFSKADEVLATAARGIAEVITHHYTQNIDLKDAKTVLTNSGTAIMGSGSASGSNRAQEAIANALDSPLLNDNKITGCKNVLLLIVSGVEEITIDEIGEINDYIQTEAGNHTNIIMGVGEDEGLGNAVAVTVIATGFGAEQQLEIANTEAKKIIHTLEDDQKVEHDLTEKEPTFVATEKQGFDAPIVEKKGSDLDELEKDFLEKEIMNMEVVYEIIEAEPEKRSSMVGELIDKVENETLSLVSDEQHLETELAEEPPTDVECETLETALDENEMPMAFTEVGEEKELFEEKQEVDNPFEVNSLADRPEAVEEPSLAFEPSVGEEVTQLFEPQMNGEEESQKFVFNEILASDLAAIEVHEPEHVVGDESQITMDFEKPYHAVGDRNEIEKPQTLESDSKEIIKLEEEEKQPERTFEFVEESVQFELKTISTEENNQEEHKESIFEENDVTNEQEATALEATNPFDQPIEETFSKNNEIRKEQLKQFNYKFKHQLQHIDDLENRPAFERKGLDLSETETPPPSRTSLSEDDNDELHLRSNNSFLHDNVD